MARLRFVPVAAALLLAGCQSLPDTQSFTDGTIALRHAVAASGGAVVAELKTSPQADVVALGSDLEKSWQVRTRTMSALVAYAQSLQAITSAGRKGEESARSLAAAGTTLVQTLGLAVPGAGSAGTLAVDTLTYAYGQIAKARAAKSLEAALAEMQPAVERIAEMLGQDLRDLDELAGDAHLLQRGRLMRATEGPRKFREALLASRTSLLDATAAELAGGTPAHQLSRADELKALDELIAREATGYAEFTAHAAALDARRRTITELTAAAQLALADWAAVHGKLLAAVRARTVPSADELIASAQRVQALVDRYRNL